MSLRNIFVTIVFAISWFLSIECQQKPLHFRKDYNLSKPLGAFYKSHVVPQKWSDALSVCMAEGAQLLIPTNKAEVDHALAISKKTLWIAAHDTFSEGEFLTFDGKALDENYYTNWKREESYNQNSDENCVAIERDGTYNDLPCNLTLNFVCKRLSNDVTQNLVCESYDPEYAYSLRTNHCYKFHSNPQMWQQAFKICKAEQAYLAVINNEDEAKLFTRMFAKHPEDSLKGTFEKSIVHLGFSDLLIQGTFLTLEGTSLSDSGYDNWAINQPDYVENNERCGSMFRDGTLNDINCNKRAMFVCEKNLTTTQTTTNKLPFQKLPDDV